MKMFFEPDDIYLHTDAVDFRKSINGLLAIVENELEFDAFSGALFIFCNKKQDKLKLLYWDKTGFALKQYAIRQAKALPLLAQFKAWLIKSEQSVLPKTKLGEAITYCLNQWDKLTVYLSDGRLSIDNNRAERAIKPFVIGRKNWLFSNTAKGADASAILYSIIETAKANGLTPFDYLMNVLTHISQGDAEVDKLLPWEQAAG